MNRKSWILATATGFAGFLLGRTIGPASLPFSESNEGRTRSADELSDEITRSLRETRTFPRASALVPLLEGLTAENVEGAARAFGASAGEDDPFDLGLFLGAWAGLDPVSAMQEVESWPIQSRRELGIRLVIREWAASGRQLEAGGYFDSVTDPAVRAVAAAPLVRGWALSGDAQGALELARRFWEREKRRDVVDPFVQGTLRRSGAPEAIRLAGELDPRSGDEFDQRVVRRTIDLAAREDPQAAAAFYVDLTTTGPVPWLAGCMRRLAGLMRNEDSRAALEWLLARPESPERTEALKETTGTWAKRDLDAAWAWFQQSRATAWVDEASTLTPTDSALLTGILRRMARVRPEEAAEWVLRLPPGPERIEMIRRVAYFWSMRDRAVADRWIGSLMLSPAERARVEEAARWGSASSDEASL